MLLAAKADPKSREAREQLKDIKALIKRKAAEEPQTMSWGEVPAVSNNLTVLIQSVTR